MTIRTWRNYCIFYTCAILLVLLHNGCVQSEVTTFDYDQSYYTMTDITKTRCKPSDSCYPTQSEIDALDATLTGRVLQKTSIEYTNESHMYNTYCQSYPNLVAMVKSKEDIVEAILFAREHNLHVTVRSSGHDFVCRSTATDSFNINLSEMKEYDVQLSTGRSDQGELKVQTGLTWAEIYQFLDLDRRCVLGGSAHTVTPGGYTLGGGHGPISRSLGYAVDNVLEIQIVLPDGRVATCTESTTVIEYPNGTSSTLNDGDLFWALRGAGSGFGVVVYIVYKLHAMPDSMVKFDTWIPLKYDTYQLDISKEVFVAMNDHILNLPDEWGGYYLTDNAKVSFPPSSTGLPYTLDVSGKLQLSMNKFSPWDGTEETVFAGIIALCNKYSIPYTFSNKTSFWDYEKDAYDPPIIRTYLAGTMLQPEKVDDDFADFLIEELFETFTNDILMGCTGIMVGGRTTEFSDDSTPLNPGYRTAISCLSCGVILNDPYLPLEQQSQWDDILIFMADRFSARLQNFGKGMYVNEPTQNDPGWRVSFWGDNYDRLLEIKRRFDPENFLTCHHCVGSANGSASSGSVFGTITFLIYVLLLYTSIFTWF